MKENFLMWLDRFLVVDVFVVIIGFIWFAMALVGKSIGIPLGWDIWYQLWQPVFNPAIGILFTGALLSGIIKKVQEKLSKS
ncbi:MAG: hypothetical protein GW856_00065 [Cyanobacteria bacterium]|uniref:hypothetical protein n=1 Tax=Geminocystis sp. TaxID=2664100 RepID=UPI001DDD3FE2|nr:hypothetical protein [Cyanobacteria bacterium CG_2015-16_32_12]NCO79590.1 hypothetical protein [Cyanobacteria bacterium CG_2015-22_32_23]NCQ03543.1 hypothetical protein [Cyanobacteria bacterium CG_2015-09_32_10]NCS85515.1 hypothetical protein [Cyanobacteria bacterium CG_2015-02_32_10]